jgi:hypothetical protein
MITAHNLAFFWLALPASISGGRQLAMAWIENSLLINPAYAAKRATGTGIT